MRSNSTIPSNWQYTYLENIADINPKFDKTKYCDELEVSFIPMKRVSELTGIVDLSETRKFAEVKKGYTPFQIGDIIFAKITPCMENGKVAILSGLLNEIGFGSTEFHVLRLPNYMPRKYLFYYLVQEIFRRDAVRNMTGSVGQKRVPAEVLKQTSITLPPLQEQHRIVNKIEELFTKLDSGVEALKQAQAQLKRCRKSVLRAAVEGRLTAEWREKHKDELEPAGKLLKRIKEERKAKVGKQYKDPVPVDTSVLPELPVGWVWASLDSIVWNTIDYRGKTPPDSESGIPIISAANVKNGKIVIEKPRYVSEETYEKWLTRGVPQPNDLIVTTEAPVGQTALFPEKGTYLLTRRVIAFQTIEVKNEFIELCFNGGAPKDHIDKNSRGTTVPRILKPALLRTPIPLPPSKEQQRIINEASRFFSIIDGIAIIIGDELQHSHSLRQSILKRAFEGKLVPQDPHDEPASALLERIKAEKAKPKKSKQMEMS